MRLHQLTSRVSCQITASLRGVFGEFGGQGSGEVRDGEGKINAERKKIQIRRRDSDHK